MIFLQDNLEILAPKPIDQKYGPYASDTDAINAIPLSYRHKGLTVGILNNSGSVIEYWWQNGIADVDLVQKVTGGGSVDLSNYYTISQVNTSLNTKANTAHTHLAADITDLSSAVLSITDNRFDGIDSLISTIQNYTLTPNNGLELLTVNDKPAAGNISFGIANNGVTFARMQQLPATSIIGNSTNATGNAQAITIGTGLAFDGTTLTSSVRNATNGLSLLSNNIELGGTLTKNTTVALSTFTFQLGSFRFNGVNASANTNIETNSVLTLQQTETAFRGLIVRGAPVNGSSAHAFIQLSPGFSNYESFINGAGGALNLITDDPNNFRFRMNNSSITIGRISTSNVSHTTHNNVLRLSTNTGDNLDLFNGSTNGSVRLNFTPNGTGSSLINTSGSSLGFQFSAITRISLNSNGIGIGTTPSTGFQFSISEASDVNLSLVSISNNVNIYSNTSIVFRDSTTGNPSFTLYRTGGIKMVASIANTITFTGSTATVDNPYNTTNVVVLTGLQSTSGNVQILSITSSQITFAGGIGNTLHYLIIEKS